MRKSICLVTGDFAGIVRNSGIGTYFLLMSRLLAQRGWYVHVLYAGDVDDDAAVRAAPARFARAGLGFTWLDDQPRPAWADCEQYGVETPRLLLSQRVFEMLESLQSEHQFDIIEFPDWDALGFRSVQAKRTSAGLRDAVLAVKLHGPTQWQREGNFEVRHSPVELKVEWCEQYAFENADVQLSPSRYMAEYMRSVDWDVRRDVAISYPFPEAEPWSIGRASRIRELVFFGRLEPRKGLELFLDALDGIDPNVPVLFMGKDTDIGGRQASERIAERLQGRAYRIETKLEREAALAELSSGDRLAVMPSISETFGFTVAECIANRVPFIAARTGAIPEIVLHEEARRRWLFPATAAGLTEALTRRLAASEAEERAIAEELAELCDARRWNDGVEQLYGSLRHRPARSRPHRPAESATVTVGIPFYDKAPFLAAALRSLAEQTRPPDEVIVIDDGSTDAEAVETFREQQALYPQWAFLQQQNAGPGPARNACLAQASGKYFVAFDADNIATPEMLETMLEAMDADESLAAATCHILAFVNDGDIGAERFLFRYSPTGGPLLLSLLQDVYGDSGAIFQADTLRAVGGFETERWSPNEDWETFVKLTVNRHRVDVIPRVLYYYRAEAGGRLQALGDRATTFRQRKRMIETFFADAPLTARQRRELWECVSGFGWAADAGIEAAVRWHQREIAALQAWRERDVAGLKEWREAEIAELHEWRERELNALRQSHERELAELRASLTARATQDDEAARIAPTRRPQWSLRRRAWWSRG